MYIVNEDKSIYVTRGDAVVLTLRANNNGVPYMFKQGEVVRFRVFEKKGCHCTVLQKDFVLAGEEAVESIDITLTKNETKIGEIISKPKDYWYEIELNPDSNPQTIVGYDDDGPKIFRVFPEGADTEGGAGEAPDEFIPAVVGYLPGVTEEDNGKSMVVVNGEWELAAVKVDVDDKMDLHSTNPVQNRVVYNEFIDVRSAMNDLDIKLGTEIDALKITATEARNTARNAQTTADEAKELANGVLPRIDALEDGGGLPKVSEEDNDKVLTVVNGEAQWALHAGLSNKQKVLFADDGEGNVSIVLVDAGEDEDSNVIVDDKLDQTSTNPVQNRVIADAFETLNRRVDTASNTANEAKTTAINAGATASSASATASSANNTANEAKTTANSALSTANEAKTAAQGASATANEAKTDASTASANANSAVITASGAYSLANEANSAASSAQQTLSGVLPRIKRLEAGGGVTVDDHIDPNSTNPLQNAVIAALIGNIRGALDGIIVLQEALIEGGKENVAAYFMRHVNDAADGIIALQEALIAGADDSVIAALLGDINDAICSVTALQNALVYAGGEDVASYINEALDGIIALQDELIAI